MLKVFKWGYLWSFLLDFSGILHLGTFEIGRALSATFTPIPVFKVVKVHLYLVFGELMLTLASCA